MYIPFNYETVNLIEGHITPSQVKLRKNAAFCYWERSLFQRLCSTLKIDLPVEWQGETRDFFYYCLFRLGYVAIFKHDKFGVTFQPCTLGGQGWYYQPTFVHISNPQYSATLDIHKDCEVIKLTPDYMGAWDIINYYAEKLALLDNAINMSLINNKFAFLLGAKNKAAAQALKKMIDKINDGEPAVIFDKEIVANGSDKEPFNFLERHNLKESYLTTDQLRDLQTIINSFDAEIGIPTVPYEKKERMVASEAKSKTFDATSRATVWLDTINSCLELVNNHYDLNITAKLRFELEGGASDESSTIIDTRVV